MTVEDRIQSAERLARARYSPGYPGVKPVLQAYYGIGEPHWYTPGGVISHVRALTAVYPLTRICPVWRDGETPTAGISTIAAAENNAKGKDVADWARCRLAAEGVLAEARAAYVEAAGHTVRRRPPTELERIDREWVATFGTTDPSI